MPAPRRPRQRPTLDVQPPSTPASSRLTSKKDKRIALLSFTCPEKSPGCAANLPLMCANVISQHNVFLVSNNRRCKGRNHPEIISAASRWLAVNGLQQQRGNLEQAAQVGKALASTSSLVYNVQMLMLIVSKTC